MEREQAAQQPVLASWQGPDSTGHRRLGMVIFMVALGMFFAVGVVCFLLYRFASSASAGMDPLYLPWELWISTVLLLLTGWWMRAMGQAARRGDCVEMGRRLRWTWALSLLFVLVQGPALAELLRVHFVYVNDGRAGVYGMAFALILLHALHVVGGMIAMGVLFWKTRATGLEQAHVPFAQICAQYWHFLAWVWAVLLAVFFWAG